MPLLVHVCVSVCVCVGVAVSVYMKQIWFAHLHALCGCMRRYYMFSVCALLHVAFEVYRHQIVLCKYYAYALCLTCSQQELAFRCVALLCVACGILKWRSCQLDVHTCGFLLPSSRCHAPHRHLQLQPTSFSLPDAVCAPSSCRCLVLQLLHVATLRIRWVLLEKSTSTLKENTLWDWYLTFN